VTPRDCLLQARALVLHDLQARGFADAGTVSLLEDAVAGRGWWVDQWDEGMPFVAGLVAQDTQDALLDRATRWPRCTACDLTAEHSLSIEPELGTDPHWVCRDSGMVVARLGQLT
jgi:hypothetical protein